MGGSIRKAVWIGAALLLAGLAGVSAQMMGGGMMGPGYGMVGYDPIERMRVALNLGDNQVAQIRNLWLEYVRATAIGQANLQIAQAELQVLLQAGRNADPNQVESRIRQISSLWASLQAAGIRYRQQLQSVLTPQQSARLDYHPGFAMIEAPFRHSGYNNLPGAGWRQRDWGLPGMGR